MDTVLYLIRHSESFPKSNINNVKNSDDSLEMNKKAILSVDGEKKALLLSQCEELKGLDAVYSSSYVRALSTAKYLADANNTVINVDERLDERIVGKMDDMEWVEFSRKQVKDKDFKLPHGESFNETKKRVTEAIKNILMFDTGNRVAVVFHSTAMTTILSAWCENGKNYDGDIILTYNDETIIDGHWDAPMVYKVTFDGMNVTNIEYVNIN